MHMYVFAVSDGGGGRRWGLSLNGGWMMKKVVGIRGGRGRHSSTAPARRPRPGGQDPGDR